MIKSDEKIIFKIKRGQVAIWIILAVVLVASLILFFLLQRFPEIVKPGESDVAFDFQSYLDECVKQSVEEAVNVMLPQGGFIQPTNSIKYDGKGVEYLCYTIQYYEPCVQQHALLKKEIKDGIRDFIFAPVDECFEGMKAETNSFEYDSDYNVAVDWGPDTINVQIIRDATIEKQGETRRFSKFDVRVQSPAYNLVEVADEIARQEGQPQRCYFENVGYSLLHNRFDIKLYNQFDDGTKLFTIRDKKTDKFMRVATRSCVSRSGL